MSYLEDTPRNPDPSDDDDWRPLVGWFAVKPHQATLSKNLSDFEERLTHRRDSPIVVVGDQSRTHTTWIDSLERETSACGGLTTPCAITAWISRVEADELRSLVSERDDKIREA